MPAITLSAEEVEPGVLPAVCIVCGGPATERVRVVFTWLPMGIWTSLILGAFAGGQLTAELPTCGPHRGHWRLRKLFVPCGLLLTLVVMGSPELFLPGNAPYPMWAWAGAFAVFVVTVVAGMVLHVGGVRTLAVSHDGVALAGVAWDFVAAVGEGRATFARQEREWVTRYDRKPGEDDTPGAEV